MASVAADTGRNTSDWSEIEGLIQWVLLQTGKMYVQSSVFISRFLPEQDIRKISDHTLITAPCAHPLTAMPISARVWERVVRSSPLAKVLYTSKPLTQHPAHVTRARYSSGTMVCGNRSHDGSILNKGLSAYRSECLGALGPV